MLSISSCSHMFAGTSMSADRDALTCRASDAAAGGRGFVCCSGLPDCEGHPARVPDRDRRARGRQLMNRRAGAESLDLKAQFLAALNHLAFRHAGEIGDDDSRPLSASIVTVPS